MYPTHPHHHHQHQQIISPTIYFISPNAPQSQYTYEHQHSYGHEGQPPQYTYAPHHTYGCEVQPHYPCQEERHEEARTSLIAANTLRTDVTNLSRAVSNAEALLESLSQKITIQKNSTEEIGKQTTAACSKIQHEISEQNERFSHQISRLEQRQTKLENMIDIEKSQRTIFADQLRRDFEEEIKKEEKKSQREVDSLSVKIKTLEDLLKPHSQKQKNDEQKIQEIQSRIQNLEQQSSTIETNFSKKFSEFKDLAFNLIFNPSNSSNAKNETPNSPPEKKEEPALDLQQAVSNETLAHQLPQKAQAACEQVPDLTPSTDPTKNYGKQEAEPVIKVVTFDVYKQTLKQDLTIRDLRNILVNTMVSSNPKFYFVEVKKTSKQLLSKTQAEITSEFKDFAINTFISSCDRSLKKTNDYPTSINYSVFAEYVRKIDKEGNNLVLIDSESNLGFTLTFETLIP